MDVLGRGPTAAVLSKALAEGGGSSPSLIILGKSALAFQDVGGANGTIVYWTWDTQIRVDSNYTHSTVSNSSRVTVAATGWYRVAFRGRIIQGGGARTTHAGILRVNGTTVYRRGSAANYSRGSAYGDQTPGLSAIFALTAGDYVEVGTEVMDTDAAYTSNTSGSDANYLCIERLE